MKMRMHFPVRTALWKYRAQLAEFELPPGEIVTQKHSMKNLPSSWRTWRTA